LIRKFHEAKTNNDAFVTIWGSGMPRREFLHADDLADACFFLMEKYNEPGFINIGIGEDIQIKDLALLVKKITGYKGNIVHDLSKPDGTPRKLLDITKLLEMGWKAKIDLEDGIAGVYSEFAKANSVHKNVV